MALLVKHDESGGLALAEQLQAAERVSAALVDESHTIEVEQQALLDIELGQRPETPGVEWPVELRHHVRVDSVQRATRRRSCCQCETQAITGAR